MVESIYDLIYGVPNLLVDAVDVQQPIPLSYLRSVGTTSSVFFLESFISELAHTAGVDDYQYGSEEHTSELQSPCNLVCRLLLEKKKTASWIRSTGRSLSWRRGPVRRAPSPLR